jgi:hydroxymethylbilane synthase
MPAIMDEDLVIAAVPPRTDPRDVLVSRSGSLADLQPGARIGTGSLRRAAQVRDLREDVVVEPVRGNVDTRVEKALGEGAELDGVVIAAAGLARTGLAILFPDSIFPLQASRFVPAPGQGILAIQSSMGRPDLIELLAPVEDRDARDALEAERAVVRSLGAGCGSSLAVYLFPDRRAWVGAAMASRPDGSDLVRVHSAGETADAAAAELLEGLVEKGAEEMVA